MTWCFRPGEDLRQAFSRVGQEEIAKIRASLASPDVDRAVAIHDARQGFKRLRALARLAGLSLGPDFPPESRRWRDAGRLLAGARDEVVLLETFDEVASGCSEVAPRTLTSLRRQLTAGGAGQAEASQAEIDRAISLLDEAAARVPDLGWPDNAEALSAGLRQSQRRLRKAWKEARRNGSAEELHLWRKRVKDQSAQLRLFRDVLPDDLLAVRKSEKATAEYLGEDHDLWLLSEGLAGKSLPPRLERAREALLAAIATRREDLQSRALRTGRAFCSTRPKEFADAVLNAWETGVSEDPPRTAEAARRARPRAISRAR